MSNVQSPMSNRFFLMLRFAFAFLPLFLLWINLTRTCSGGRGRCFSLRFFRFRFWSSRSRRFIILWRWRQRDLFQLRLRCGRRSSGFIASLLLRLRSILRTFGSEFALSLTEQLLHVFRHFRRLRKVLLRFVLQKVLHELVE